MKLDTLKEEELRLNGRRRVSVVQGSLWGHSGQVSTSHRSDDGATFTRCFVTLARGFPDWISFEGLARSHRGSSTTLPFSLFSLHVRDTRIQYPLGALVLTTLTLENRHIP